MIDFLFSLVVHTPLWVWLVLALLVRLGLKQTVAQRVPAQRILVLPFVIGVLSLNGAWTAFGAAAGLQAIVSWTLGAAIGAAANRTLDLPRGVVANADGSFLIPGSYAPLALLLGVFVVRYTVNVALAVGPALAFQPVFAIAACAAYGLPAGLYAARARKVWSTRSTAAAATAA